MPRRWVCDASAFDWNVYAFCTADSCALADPLARSGSLQLAVQLAPVHHSPHIHMHPAEEEFARCRMSLQMLIDLHTDEACSLHCPRASLVARRRLPYSFPTHSPSLERHGVCSRTSPAALEDAVISLCQASIHNPAVCVWAAPAANSTVPAQMWRWSAACWRCQWATPCTCTAWPPAPWTRCCRGTRRPSPQRASSGTAIARCGQMAAGGSLSPKPPCHKTTGKLKSPASPTSRSRQPQPPSANLSAALLNACSRLPNLAWRCSPPRGVIATRTFRCQLCKAQLCTASLDGTLGVWDVESGRQTRTVAVGQPIVGLAVPPGGSLAHLSVTWKDRGTGRVTFLITLWYRTLPFKETQAACMSNCCPHAFLASLAFLACNGCMHPEPLPACRSSRVTRGPVPGAPELLTKATRSAVPLTRRNPALSHHT